MTLRCEASGVPPPTIQVGASKSSIMALAPALGGWLGQRGVSLSRIWIPITLQQKNKIMQKRKLTRKCSYLNVASGTNLWARYQEASLDVEELVLQLLSSPGCQQDHCLNLSLSICPHHLHRHYRSAAGDYMCTASNGVGPLQHATITLSVLCKFVLPLFSFLCKKYHQRWK